MNNDLSFADLISEIFEGKTEIESSFGTIYFKHFNQLQTSKVFCQTDKYKKEAIAKGISTEEEALEALIKDGFWSREKEREILVKKKELEDLKGGLNALKLPSQKQKKKKEIESIQNFLEESFKEKVALMGITAEIYADKKVNKLFFDSISFLNKDCTIKVIDELDYQDVAQQSEFQKIQKDFFQKFDDKYISKAVLSPSFASYLPYSESVLDFFGKPIKDLTTFQLKLISYSRSFLNIFKNCPKDIPKDIARDPDLLVDFYESAKDADKKKSSKASDGTGGTTYFGASKTDLKAVASDDENVVSLSDSIAQQGGKLNMQEMMKLHGI